MKNQKKKSCEEEQGTATPHAWRVTWTMRTPLGLWEYHQRIEYAESKSLAVNQALAKIRRDYPHGLVAACEEITSVALPPASPA